MISPPAERLRVCAAGVGLAEGDEGPEEGTLLVYSALVATRARRDFEDVFGGGSSAGAGSSGGVGGRRVDEVTNSNAVLTASGHIGLWEG